MTSTGGIDPRLRQRRIAVRRAQGRQRLRILLFLIAVGAVSYGGWRVSQSEILDVDQVVVAGAFGTEAEQVRAASGLTLGEPMVSADLEQAELRVTDLPWVAEAAATKDWRSTVRIDVVRRIPYAALRTDANRFVVVDESGVAMSLVGGAEVGELPIVDVAPKGELGDVQQDSLPGLAMVAAMPADVDPWVEQIVVSTNSAGAISLGVVLVGGVPVEFGDSRLLADKFEALRSVLAGRVLACVASIDVRVADLATVLPDLECEAAIAEAASS